MMGQEKSRVGQMEAGNRGRVTYSPAYTMVPTYECFNRCSYCNFRQELGSKGGLELERAAKILDSLGDRGVVEILILSGEVHPQSAGRKGWFDRIYKLCDLALSKGFLPHTNAGPLYFAEMAKLKSVNLSMGLMLEQLSPKLLQTVHRHAPSKQPAVRLRQLEWAGELEIPFTTGILLGLGETREEICETLEEIARLHQRWGHIQEAIVQPYSPGTRQTGDAPGFDLQELPAIIAIARDILPPSITIQIPPNLVTQPDLLLACIAAGARDLGGIGPRDEVNPDYPHPQIAQLQEILHPVGWQLRPRSPIYPQHYPWLTPRQQNALRQALLILADPV